ncbi:MAG: type transport system ATP-binding protein [Mycobacteriales bacterium]
MAAASPAASVSLRNVVKRYPRSPANAVDGVSLDVTRGEIFGLLGPNGAGKTTTVGILTTRVRPTAGTAYVAGVDVTAQPVRARARFAVIPQRPDIDRSLSVEQNLLFHALYHGVPRRIAQSRAAALLARFDLAGRGKDKADRLSGGQAQRVIVARALMHSPSVLFCDEPTTGLDPAARLFLWDSLRELAAAGVTIVLTTHDMTEATRLAGRVAIMDRGRILAVDTPDALIKRLPSGQTLDLTLAAVPSGGAESLLAAAGDLAGVRRVEQVSSAAGGADPRLRLRLYVDDGAAALLPALVRLLDEFGTPVVDVSIDRPSLDDVFLIYTGRSLR